LKEQQQKMRKNKDFKQEKCNATTQCDYTKYLHAEIKNLKEEIRFLENENGTLKDDNNSDSLLQEDRSLKFREQSKGQPYTDRLYVEEKGV